MDWETDVKHAYPESEKNCRYEISKKIFKFMKDKAKNITSSLLDQYRYVYFWFWKKKKVTPSTLNLGDPNECPSHASKWHDSSARVASDVRRFLSFNPILQSCVNSVIRGIRRSSSGSKETSMLRESYGKIQPARTEIHSLAFSSFSSSPGVELG